MFLPRFCGGGEIDGVKACAIVTKPKAQNRRLVIHMGLMCCVLDLRLRRPPGAAPADPQTTTALLMSSNNNTNMTSRWWCPCCHKFCAKHCSHIILTQQLCIDGWLLYCWHFIENWFIFELIYISYSNCNQIWERERLKHVFSLM